MTEAFLHGVDVVEIDSGVRPIQTVRSAVIGLVGTAPDSAPAVAAALTTGVVASNNAMTWTAKASGAAGNNITVRLKDPGANSASLSVDVNNGDDIVVNLATSVAGAITSTAAQIKTAVEADTEANALVAVANASTSTGAGVVTAVAATALTGGVDEPFPLDTPRLIAGSRLEAAKLGSTGTLPDAIDGIFDQTGALIVVVRVAVGNDDAATRTNVIGGVDATTGKYEGVHALLGAESALGVTPRILIAPGFTEHVTKTGEEITGAPVTTEMVAIADKLRAVIVADGPNTNDADAQAYRDLFGSARVYVIDPKVKVLLDGVETVKPASPRVAGVICRTDNQRGFWWSPSNQEINGTIGVARPIDFVLGDDTSRANLLNEHEVATIIRKDGYRLWGNRTCSSDPKWAFLSVRRIADMVNDSLLRAHMWAVDRNITKSYIDEVVGGVDAYLRDLKAKGAIINGKCWADPDLNTPENIASGKVYFNFDFTPPYPAEHITFRSILTNDYLSEVLE